MKCPTPSILLLSALFILGASCSKSSDPDPGPSGGSLSTTESALIGSWHMDATHDTIWNYYNGVVFMTTTHDSTNYDHYHVLEFQTGVATTFTGLYPAAKNCIDRRYDPGGLNYWFYDSLTSKLHLSGLYYTIRNIDAHHLTLLHTDSFTTSTSALARSYYLFSR